MTDSRVGAVILTGSAETARLFLGWRPDLPCSRRRAARTPSSSPRWRIGTRRSATSFDRPSATTARSARPRVSPFARPRCTTIPDFRRQLRDAAASLACRQRVAAGKPRHSAHSVPGRGAPARADRPRRGGGVAARAAAGAGQSRSSGHPASSSGCASDRSSTAPSASAPCSGSCAPTDLDEAIALANATPFGLTSGIQTLDDREIARWVDRLDAGTLYVNRPITGAIVGRQPFGGWKASSVGPGAKAGGPNYVLQLGRWRQVTAAVRWRRAPAGAAGRAARAMPGRAVRRRGERALLQGQRGELRAAHGADHFSREHDPAADPRRAERVPLPTVPAGRRARRRRGRRHALPGGARGLRAGVPLTVSLAPDSPSARGSPSADGVDGRRGERRRASWSAWRTRRTRSACGSGGRSRRGPRRRQRRRPHRHRRARPRQRPPRAPLVPPRADGLADGCTAMAASPELAATG